MKPIAQSAIPILTSLVGAPAIFKLVSEDREAGRTNSVQYLCSPICLYAGTSPFLKLVQSLPSISVAHLKRLVSGEGSAFVTLGILAL